MLEDEPETVPATAIAEFQRAIDKAYKLINLYPGSKWVDDAVLLIGKSHFQRREYSDARFKFKELIDNFPESDLLSEARYYYAESYMLEGNLDAAETEFSFIMESDQEKFDKFKDMALYNLGELSFENEEFDKALSYYENYITVSNNDYRKKEAQLKIADCKFFLEDYENASLDYKKVINSNPNYLVKFRAEFGLGTCIEYQEDYDAAIVHFGSLLPSDEFIFGYRELFLEIARCWDLKGNVEQAIFVLTLLNEIDPEKDIRIEMKKIDVEVMVNYDPTSIEEFNREKEAALTDSTINSNVVNNPESMFYIGELILSHFSNIDSAKIYYEKARGGTPSEEIVDVLDDRLESINIILDKDTKLNTAAPPVKPVIISANPDSIFVTDSLKTKEEIIEEIRSTNEKALEDYQIAQENYLKEITENLYIIAEEYYMRLNKPDSSIKYLENIVNDYPQTKYAPKALLMKMTLLAENDNLQEAESVKMRLLEDYPDSEYAFFVTGETYEFIDTKITARDSIEILYESAENALTEGMYELAVSRFDSIISNYNDQYWRPKALLAKAFILENHLKDSETAIEVYRKVFDEYKNTEFGKSVSDKISEVDKYLVRKKRLEAVALLEAQLMNSDNDSLVIELKMNKIENPDSSFLIYLDEDSLLSPAKIFNNVEPVYPDSLVKLEISGYINVVIHIDESGGLMDAEIFSNTTQIKELEEFIMISLEETGFYPAMDVENRPVKSRNLKRFVFKSKK
ncbi:tetratricopeptide repeat protein [candidate division KSB1 bacterium]